MLRAAIIGCGAIAGGYDTPADAHVLTHAKAYQTNPGVALVAAADPDEKQRTAFQKKWNAPAVFADVEQMLQSCSPDIISICSPSKHHAEHLRQALRIRPRAVWCEKPIAYLNSEAQQCIDEYAAAGVLLAVNYSRRWDPVLTAIGDRCRAGAATLKVSVLYGKGLYNNGSHAIDLLCDWLGPIGRTVPLDEFVDWQPDDPTRTAYLEFESGAQVMLIGTDEREATIWEIDIIGPGWRVRITDAGEGVEEYATAPDPLFPGYRALAKIATRSTELHNTMAVALSNIINAITHGEALRSSGATAMKTLANCNRISEAFTSNRFGRNV